MRLSACFLSPGTPLTLSLRRRQQLKTLPVRTPTWLKLYDVLVQLEKEIDETLPEFQELAVVLSCVLAPFARFF